MDNDVAVHLLNLLDFFLKPLPLGLVRGVSSVHGAAGRQEDHLAGSLVAWMPGSLAPGSLALWLPGYIEAMEVDKGMREGIKSGRWGERAEAKCLSEVPESEFV